MSGTILRRNTSKEGLHNLLRLTTQRSIEDAEEREREHRRRAREAARIHAGTVGSWGAQPDSVSQSEDSTPQSDSSLPQTAPQCEDNVPQYNMSHCEDRAPPNKERTLDAGLKPDCQAPLEEDEGFSDWTLKLGGNHRLHPGEQSPDRACSADGPLLPTQLTSRQQQDEEENKEEGEMEEGERRGQRGQWEREEEETTDTKKRELDTRKKVEEKQRKVTYVSRIFLHQEKRYIICNGDAPGEEMTSCKITTNRILKSPPVVEEVEDDTGEVEVKLEVMQSSQREKERQEREQFRRRQFEAATELEELRKKREDRRRAREEDGHRGEEEEQQQQAQEEEYRRQIRAEIERKSIEAAERMKSLSISVGEEPFSPVSPKSPTFKDETEERVTAENTSSIIERTESLNRSLKKNNSVKTLPPVFISTINDRLKQYTHALETSCREGRPTVTDILRSPEPVALKKSLFEAGDAWSATKNLQHKNVKLGDVLPEKNLRESVRVTSSGGAAGKATLCGKRYKFVVTGHGKYEKMSVNGDGHE